MMHYYIIIWLKQVVTVKEILNLWKCFVLTPLIPYQSTWRKMNHKIGWDAQPACNVFMKYVFNGRLTSYTVVYYSRTARQRIDVTDLL